MENFGYTKYGIDYFCDRFEWINILTIHDYPIVAIFWNIFLLIIPYYSVVLLIKYKKSTGFKKPIQKFFGIFMFFIWLMFIPNSAYIISDVRHLLDYCPAFSPLRVCSENAWMIIFFFTYASIGWVSMVYLVNQMKKFISELFNKKAANSFVFFIIPLISLGLLLGLVNRWNSWEIFIYPASLVNNIFWYFTDFFYFRNWLIFTLFLYLLYYGGNFLFKENINLRK